MSVPNEIAFQAMLERLRAYQWPKHGKGTHHASTLLLAGEYYRRMLLWGRALNCQLTGHQWAFFSVIRHIGLKFDVDEKIFDEISHIKGITPETKASFLWILKWAAMGDSLEVKQFQLSAPYDPLLFMYDRGSQFYRGIGDAGIEIMDAESSLGRVIGILRYYEKTTPFVELDHAVLDALDAAFDAHPVSIFKLNRIALEELESRDKAAGNTPEEHD